jgi:hypothetical protein
MSLEKALRKRYATSLLKNTYTNTIKRNPFYDDTYSILYEFEDGRKEERKLVEFSEIELLEIRYMIDKLLNKEN